MATVLKGDLWLTEDKLREAWLTQKQALVGVAGAVPVHKGPAWWPEGLWGNAIEQKPVKAVHAFKAVRTPKGPDRWSPEQSTELDTPVTASTWQRLNDRRVYLLRKHRHETLTPEEGKELDRLRVEMRRYLKNKYPNRYAPLPE